MCFKCFPLLGPIACGQNGRSDHSCHCEPLFSVDLAVRLCYSATATSASAWSTFALSIISFEMSAVTKGLRRSTSRASASRSAPKSAAKRRAAAPKTARPKAKRAVAQKATTRKTAKAKSLGKEQVDEKGCCQKEGCHETTRHEESRRSQADSAKVSLADRIRRQSLRESKRLKRSRRCVHNDPRPSFSPPRQPTVDESAALKGFRASAQRIYSRSLRRSTQSISRAAREILSGFGSSGARAHLSRCCGCASANGKHTAPRCRLAL